MPNLKNENVGFGEGEGIGDSKNCCSTARLQNLYNVDLSHANNILQKQAN